MQKKILFFDIDGTLGVRGRIMPENLEALKQLKEQGYLTFICTGRAPFYAKRLFKDLVSGIVCCNGRYIIYQNEKLYGKAFAKEELAAYQKCMDEVRVGAMLVSDECAMAYRLKEQEEIFLKKEYGEERVSELSELPVYTFDLFYQDREQYQEMVQAFQDQLVINDHGGRGHCDCSTIGFDKGDAIRYLLTYFQIAKEDSYAFGDGYNDLAMFREVGRGIAMGNAVDVLKEKASFITDDYDKNGIVNALVHEKLIHG